MRPQHGSQHCYPLQPTQVSGSFSYRSGSPFLSESLVLWTWKVEGSGKAEEVCRIGEEHS